MRRKETLGTDGVRGPGLRVLVNRGRRHRVLGGTGTCAPTLLEVILSPGETPGSELFPESDPSVHRSTEALGDRTLSKIVGIPGSTGVSRGGSEGSTVILGPPESGPRGVEGVWRWGSPGPPSPSTSELAVRPSVSTAARVSGDPPCIRSLFCASTETSLPPGLRSPDG